MAKVMTACGPIETAQMGQTLIHEHLIMALPGWDSTLTLSTTKQN